MKGEIKIRGLEPILVKQIDLIAKEKRLSRNEFLRRHIESFLLFRHESKQLEETKEIVRKNIIAMEKMTDVTDELRNLLKVLIGEDDD
ncbi:hypothetical protein C6Y02_16995 [Bacillus sp. NMCC4]|uniref:hypothetical protein n=1 Tax=Bacillus sp. NMCC4 TaxID=2108539 RepID=UPI000D04057E|nr:hypothetical protein [Bacillus sp. NMCC4]PRS35710.1 hypothetical protein C6Y02_16995 [Bacillus sp. NMCC4]